jgi:probable HAF family extracellular repeat protein
MFMAFFAIQAFANPVLCSPAYGDITQLNMSLGGSHCINNAGQIVGGNLLYQNGVTTDLGTIMTGWTNIQASAINESGQIVGYGTNPTGAQHAFLLSDGVPTDLGTLGGATSRANAINSSGLIVGESVTITGNTHAFVYDNGIMTDINPNSYVSSSATAINSWGAVVGNCEGGTIAYNSFYYANGTTSPHGSLPTWGRAYDINDSGQIVGVGNYPRYYRYAYSSGGYLGYVSAGGVGSGESIHSEAYGENELGAVVGYFDPDNAISGDGYSTGANPVAFVSQGGQMLDLNILIDPSTGWRLTSAVAINDYNQVVGYGNLGAFLITTPEPTSLALLTLGAAVLLSRRRVAANRGDRQG